MPFLYVLLFTAVISPAGHSAELGGICPTTDTVHVQAKSIEVQACKDQMKALDCEKFFEDNYVPENMQNDCTQGFWDYFSTAKNADWLAACGSGMWDGLGEDFFSAGLSSVYDEFHKDDKPTPSLELKHQRAEKYRQAIRDQVDFNALPLKEKEKLWDAGQEEVRRRVAASHLIDDALKGVRVVRACYKPEKQLELSCVGAAMVIQTVSMAKFGGWIAKGGIKRAALATKEGIQNLLYKTAGFGKPAGSAAEFLSSAAAKVETKLGYRPPVTPTAEARADFLALQATHPEYTTTRLAQITGDLTDGGKTVSHLDIKVLNDNNFQKGLSGLMLAEALQRYPKIQKISTQLTGVNATELVKYLRQGIPCAEAIMLTPSYKIRRDAGFTKFVGRPVCERAAGVFHYVVERP